jgi:hypothetical protein
MRKHIWMPAVISLGALSAATVLTLRARVGATSPHESSDSAELQALGEELRDLRNDRQRLSSQLGDLERRLTKVGTSPKRDPGPEARAATPGREPSSKSADELMQEQLALFRDHTRAEPADPAWSDDAAKMLARTFDGTRSGGAVKVEQAECFSSLCKAELRFPSAKDQELGVRQLLANLPWAAESFIQLDIATADRGLLYLAREGRALPRLGHP